jgi:hypothetical protein
VSDNAGWRLAIGLALLTAALCIAIALDVTPYLRGPGEYPPEWRWGWQPFVLTAVGLAACLIAWGLLMGWTWLAARRGWPAARVVTGLALIGMGLVITVHSAALGEPSLVARTLNPAYFGYFGPATEVDDLRTFLAGYADAQPDFDNPRMESHPPGHVVFNWLVIQVVKATPGTSQLAERLIAPRMAALPAWAADYTPLEALAGAVVGGLIPVLSVLAVVPLYLLARQAYGETAAQRAGVLYLLAPSLTLFQPVVDETFALICALALWLAYLALKQSDVAAGSAKRPASAASGVSPTKAGVLLYLAGLVISVGTFASLSVLPLGLMVGLFIVAATWEEMRAAPRSGLSRLAARLAIFGLGALTVWALAWLWAGLPPLRVLRTSLLEADTVQRGRNYWYWLVYGPYDVLLFAGIPTAGLALARLIRLIRARRGLQISLADRLLIAFALGMAALAVSGSLKGEVARTLIYTLPPLALFAGAESQDAEMDGRAFGLVAAAAFVQLIAFRGWLEVYH